MIKNRLLLLSALILFFYSCNEYIPKPHGFFRIDLPGHAYKEINKFPEFNLLISEQAALEIIPDTGKGMWLNVTYPVFQAKIYCSYLPVNAVTLEEAMEDNHRFVYSHTLKADNITEKAYNNPETNVYAKIYQLKGNVATPVQFVITDSSKHFFRGSLLFNSTPNQDSIRPVLEYLQEDIRELIENFNWKN